ncbi:hypothetical protein VTO73DRAFT_10469 [Trametes versicolor]
MPHRRLSSAGTCQVVPRENELPCPDRGYGDRPRLCPAHRAEYAQLTAQYKATSEEAEGLYTRVRSQDWDDATLWNLIDVQEGIASASLCIDTLNREIRERQEHHRRFFIELHDGHEAWINRLRKKLVQVEAVATQLGHCQTALIDDQKRRGEQTRLAEERRKRAAARRSYLNDFGAILRSIPASTHKYDYCVRPETNRASPKSTRPVCVTYLANNSRCALEAMYGAVRCQEHQDAFTQTLSSLRAAEQQYGDMGASVYTIRCRDDHTLSQVTQNIPYVARYLTLADTITALAGKLRRLDGYSKPIDAYREANMSIYGLRRDVVENLRNKLEGIRSNLMRPKPAAAAQKPYRAPTRETAPQHRSEDEGTGWVGAIVAAAVVGVAAFFRFGR